MIQHFVFRKSIQIITWKPLLVNFPNRQTGSQMNEHDVQLMKSLMNSIGEGMDGGVVLIDVPSTQFVRVNLVLLKGLMEDRGRQGIFISVDRPHQYMVHLMKMHQISLDDVTFIDVISRFSSDRKGGKARVGFVDAPFHIDSLPSALEKSSDGCGSGIIPLEDCGFAMIDNIAALQIYNRNPSVELFINNFILTAKSHGSMLVPMVLDKSRHESLYRSAQKLSDVEIKIEKDLTFATRNSGFEFSGQRVISEADYNRGRY